LAQEFEDVAQHTKAVLRSVDIEPVELEKTAAQGGVYFEKKNAPAGHKSECY
jgi:hypothetical protein